MNKETKDLLLKELLSFGITILATVALAMGASINEAVEISFTVSFWTGVLLAGARACIKAIAIGLPNLVLSIKEYLDNR